VFGAHAELRREHVRDLVQNLFGDGQLDPISAGNFDQLKRFAVPEQGARLMKTRPQGQRFGRLPRRCARDAIVNTERPSVEAATHPLPTLQTSHPSNTAAKTLQYGSPAVSWSI
jgi:hypothetical protein